MSPLKNMSIKRKVTLSTMLTSALVLVLVCGGFVGFEVTGFQDTMREDLTVLADTIATNSTAALAFQDQKAASEVLAALAADPHVVEACLYDGSGQPFASFNRNGSNTSFGPPAIRPDGGYLNGSHLDLFRQIELSGELIGTIYIRSDLEEMKRRIRNYGILCFVLLGVSILSAFLLSSLFQQMISKPILDLAYAAEVVSCEKDYSIHVVKAAGMKSVF